jgi:thiamine phosphate synthase YjbQ (UPF0047 family)
MKSFRKEIWFNIPTRRAYLNITHQVEECLHQSGIQEGMILINAMHITASVFIMMMNRVYIRILKCGWKLWLPKAL